MTCRKNYCFGLENNFLIVDMYAYAGSGPPHYAPPPTYLQPHPPSGPPTHHVQVPPVAMGHQEPSPVGQYSKKRRYDLIFLQLYIWYILISGLCFFLYEIALWFVAIAGVACLWWTRKKSVESVWKDIFLNISLSVRSFL